VAGSARQGNTRAQQVYLRRGFVPASASARATTPPSTAEREDAVVMNLRLEQP
jgi:hypothetical protein